MRRSLFRVAGSMLWLGLLAACSLTQSLDGYSGGEGGVSCGAGEKECAGTCRSTRDPLFGCGSAACTPCAFTHAGVAGCDNAGACVLGPCANGFADCDGVVANGCEVETDTDPGHCGACAKDCGSVASGVTACQGGVCQVRTCTAPLANCDGKFESGCAVDTSSDVAHCGSCATPCPTLAGTTFTCASSACKVSACADALIDCNGVVSDGCECGAPHAVAKCVVPGSDAGVNSDAGSVADAGDAGDTSAEAGGSTAPGACVMSGECQPGFANCNGNLAGDGCETALLTDKTNCGACGWSCNGVECGGGYCTPTSIIGTQPNPGQLAIDRFYAYWTNYGVGSVPGSVYSVQKDGTNPVPIAGGVSDPNEQEAWGVAASDYDSHVYWTTFDKLANSHIGRQLKAGGGAPTRIPFPLVNGQPGGKARALAVDIDTSGVGFVYWATFDTNILYRLPLPSFSGTPEIVAQGEPYVRGPNNIVADGGAIYWTNEGTPGSGATTANTGSVVSMTKPVTDGGAPVFTTLVVNANAPRGIAVDAGNVFFTDSGYQSTQSGKVRRILKTGASQTPVDLVTGLGNTRELALCHASLPTDCTTDKWVYFTSYTDGTVQRVLKDGTKVQTLATGQNFPIGIAVDDAAVFWANYGTKATPNGTIARLPKPKN
jgi:hypothetical protein